MDCKIFSNTFREQERKREKQRERERERERKRESFAPFVCNITEKH